MRAFINATIYQRTETAFLIEDGAFLRFGRDEEIQNQLEEGEECVDLNGALVLPGFVDSHMHLLEYGSFLNTLQLLDCTSIEDVYRRLKSYAASCESSWIIGRGYNEELFKEPISPTRAMLDELVPDRPVSLTRACGHVLIANTKALELAGIDANTEVDGGKIFYETGRIEENAIELIHAVWPEENAESMMKHILRGAEECNRHGITSVGSDDFISVSHNWHFVLDAFMKLSFQGKLKVRVNEQCEFEKPEELAKFLDEGYTTGVGDSFFQIGPLKMITDGSLGARTAAMAKPYADANTAGYTTHTDEELDTFVELANRYNMPTISHCIGDAALDQVLKIYESYVLPENPLHYGIVHCQIMRPDQIQKVTEQKLDCYFQSLFINSDAKILEDRVGKELAKTSYPFKTLFEHCVASNGSDAPVEVPNPLKGIQLAVTRKTFDSLASMEPSECLSVSEAIASYTICGAKNNQMDSMTGSLEVGYFADFVVLDQDITNCPVEEIGNTKVWMTVVNGETVYEK